MMIGRGRFLAALAGGLVAAGVLAGAADAAMLRPGSAIHRDIVEVQWSDPGYVQPGPGYVQPAPGYAQPAPGYVQEWRSPREHCLRMGERLHEIRYRLQYADPWERERLGSRFYEIRERLRQECSGNWRDDE